MRCRKYAKREFTMSMDLPFHDKPNHNAQFKQLALQYNEVMQKRITGAMAVYETTRAKEKLTESDASEGESEDRDVEVT
jgi:hypothetical protein